MVHGREIDATTFRSRFTGCSTPGKQIFVHSFHLASSVSLCNLDLADIPSTMSKCDRFDLVPLKIDIIILRNDGECLIAIIREPLLIALLTQIDAGLCGAFARFRMRSCLINHMTY